MLMSSCFLAFRLYRENRRRQCSNIVQTKHQIIPKYLRAARIWWAALRLLRARQAEASLRQEKKRLLGQFLDIFLWTRLNSYVGDEDGGVLGGWVGTDSDLPDALPRSLPLPDLPDHPRRDLAFNNYNRPRRRTHATSPFPRTTAPSG